MVTKFALCHETVSNPQIGIRTPKEAFDIIAEARYDAVETTHLAYEKPIWDIGSSERDAIATAADSAGLDILGGHWWLSLNEYKGKPIHIMGYDFKNNRFDRDVLNNSIEFGQMALRFVGDLGGKIEVLGSPNQRNLPPGVQFQGGTKGKDGLGYLKEFLERMHTVQEQYGITVCLEPLAPLPDGRTDFITDDVAAHEALNRIDSRYCGLLLDVKAMAAVGNPVEIIKRNSPERLKHVHVQDESKTAAGQGRTRMTPILKALKEIGYSGYVSEEHFIYDPDPVGLAKSACSYLNNCNRGVKLWG